MSYFFSLKEPKDISASLVLYRKPLINKIAKPVPNFPQPILLVFSHGLFSLALLPARLTNGWQIKNFLCFFMTNSCTRITIHTQGRNKASGQDHSVAKKSSVKLSRKTLSVPRVKAV